MISFRLTARERYAAYNNYISMYVLPLLKRTWSLVGACRGLIAVDGVTLPAWRDYNDLANETDDCSNLVASLLGSARMRAMLKAGIWIMTLLRIPVCCEFD